MLAASEFVLMALALSIVSVSADSASPTKTAYATIYYEIGRNDYEYYLGVRVLLATLAKHSEAVKRKEADLVVIVAPGTSPQYIKGFQDDGAVLVHLRDDDNLDTPYKAKTARRFKFVLNKLHAWKLTQYRRVVMMDADVIAVTNPDALFRCGHFCAVYMNPISFHTGIFVVKPDLATHAKLLAATGRMASFDGADQGFLNSYFAHLQFAPMFNASAMTLSDDEANRLPIWFSMNHVYFYERFTWDGPYQGAKSIVCMTYPITQPFKPWNWYGYPALPMNNQWHAERMSSFDSMTHYTGAIAWLALGIPAAVFYVVPLLLSRLERSSAGVKAAVSASPPSAAAELMLRATQWPYVNAALVVLLSFQASLKIVPGYVPWSLAWPSFILSQGLIIWLAANVVTAFRCAASRRSFVASAPSRSSLLRYFLSFAAFHLLLGADIYNHFVFKIMALVFVLVLTGGASLRMALDSLGHRPQDGAGKPPLNVPQPPRTPDASPQHSEGEPPAGSAA